MTLDVIAHALRYAARGWAVFPCGWQDEARKHPLTKHGCLDASRDSSIIEAWWQRWPRANVAVATGAVSGTDALDIDPRHGGDVSLAVLVAQYGRLPTTIRAFTGGGGIMFCFVTCPASPMPGVDYLSASTLGGMAAISWLPPAFIRTAALMRGM
jgi:hypothetical protein